MVIRETKQGFFFPRKESSLPSAPRFLPTKAVAEAEQ